jgi:hypothetical protein
VAHATPIPDGPTERLSSKPQKPPKPRVKRPWTTLLLIGVAVLALNLALGAGYVAWRALTVARHAATAGAPAPAPSAPVTAPTTTSFSVAYAQEPLRVQVGCSAVLFIDLDEPRANADERVSDLRYDSSCGNQAPRLSLGPGAAAGAQIKDPDIDAAGCDQAIRTSPLGPGATVEVKTGVVLCVLTAARPAQMALVEITAVGPTGVAAMRATSWKVSR